MCVERVSVLLEGEFALSDDGCRGGFAGVESLEGTAVAAPVVRVVQVEVAGRCEVDQFAFGGVVDVVVTVALGTGGGDEHGECRHAAGMPTEAEHIGAFKSAACAQAEYWLGTGEESAPPASGRTSRSARSASAAPRTSPTARQVAHPRDRDPTAAPGWPAARHRRVPVTGDRAHSIDGTYTFGCRSIR